MSLEKEFIPYEQALALKELGLKIKSPAFYNPNGVLFYKWKEVEENEEAISLLEIIKYYDDVITDRVDVPTFSQAFRWFREKYKMTSSVRAYFGEEFFCEIYVSFNHEITSGMYNSYEETELACLKKLIEIVKEKQP